MPELLKVYNSDEDREWDEYWGQLTEAQKRHIVKNIDDYVAKYSLNPDKKLP